MKQGTMKAMEIIAFLSILSFSDATRSFRATEYNKALDQRDRRGIDWEDEIFEERFLRAGALSMDPFLKIPTLPQTSSPMVVAPVVQPQPTPTDVSQPSLLPTDNDAPSTSTTTPSTSTPMNFTLSSRIPLCLVDSKGFSIPPNDPRSVDPETLTRSSQDVTFADVQATQDVISTALDLAAGSLGGAADAIVMFNEGEAGKAVRMSLRWATSFFALSAIAGVASMAINLFGVGGPSMDDILLETVQNGFQALDQKLNALQRDIREGLLDLSILIGDVTLDELASRLDIIARAYSDFVNATPENRAAKYGPRLRAVCNEPFKTPQDIFYDFYGYVCHTCEFASRKRADLLQLAVEKSSVGVTSGSEFMRIFGDFIQRSMSNAFFFHTVCLAPVDGSCLDQSLDSVWAVGIVNMNASFIEAANNTLRVAEELDRNWVQSLSADDLKELITEGGTTQEFAQSINRFLAMRQPDFDIQVVVAKRDNELTEKYLARAGCMKTDVDTCTTDRDNTGHLWFDNVDEHTVSVRYRLRSLPPPSRTIDVGGLVDFAGWYRDYATEQLGIVDLNNVRFTNRPCEPIEISVAGLTLSVVKWAACLVPACMGCDDNERIAFENTVSLTNHLAFRLQDTGETFSGLAVSFSSNLTEERSNEVFPSVDVRFLQQTADDDPYRFYFV